jgi:hypothetical protein
LCAQLGFEILGERPHPTKPDPLSSHFEIQIKNCLVIR